MKEALFRRHKHPLRECSKKAFDHCLLICSVIIVRHCLRALDPCVWRSTPHAITTMARVACKLAASHVRISRHLRIQIHSRQTILCFLWLMQWFNNADHELYWGASLLSLAAPEADVELSAVIHESHWFLCGPFFCCIGAPNFEGR